MWVGSLRHRVRQRTRELNREIEEHKRTESELQTEIAERKRMEIQVEKTHRELLLASRQAGMAEVATGVLHNVGNVLNSVNVSASLLTGYIKDSRLNSLNKAVALLNNHGADLAGFLSEDPKGRLLPSYLGQLAERLGNEQETSLAELRQLTANIDHIKEIVAMQQNYATTRGILECVRITEVVEDALRMNSGSFTRHNVQLQRNYQPNLPEVMVDRHKILQILNNLIRNAKYACDDAARPDKRIVITIVSAEDCVQISVADNGVGIPSENMNRIFNHGFTTRKQGHGFGLHSGALAAKEMGGTLSARSDGAGQGAVFTVELPIRAKANAAPPERDKDVAA
jgi:C4-dicarboxylate-specific signal transduction histidine kinase